MGAYNNIDTYTITIDPKITNCQSLLPINISSYTVLHITVVMIILLITLTVAPVLVTILPPILVLTDGIAKCAGNGFTAYYDHMKIASITYSVMAKL